VGSPYAASDPPGREVTEAAASVHPP